MSDRHNYAYIPNQPPPRGSQWLPSGQHSPRPPSSYQQAQHGYQAAPSNHIPSHHASSSPYAMNSMPQSSPHYQANSSAVVPPPPPPSQQQQQQHHSNAVSSYSQRPLYPQAEYPMRQPAHPPHQPAYPSAMPARSPALSNPMYPAPSYVNDGHMAPSTVQYPASPSRPFSCDMCALSFNRQHDLKRHRDTHSGEKPFLCNGGCGKTFTRKDALKRHQLVKHCGYDEDAS